MNEPREIRPEPIQQMAKMGALFAVPMGLMFGLMGAVFGVVIGIPLGPCAVIIALMAGGGLGFSCGAISGILFGGMMGVFMQSMLPRGLPPGDLEEGEQVRIYGPANHLRGIEGVGGILSLTDRRLRFVPHNINFQTGPAAWPLADISGAQTGKNLVFLHNRLEVALTDGSEQRFVLQLPQEWCSALTEET